MEDKFNSLSIIIPACVATLILIYIFTKKALIRCVFCRKVTFPISQSVPNDYDNLIEQIEKYEMEKVDPYFLNICRHCSIIFNRIPRDYALLSFDYIDKEKAIKEGVRLRVDDLVCHKCGNTLSDHDSPALNKVERELVVDTAREVKADIALKHFCVECSSIHLWCYLGSDKYRYLQIVKPVQKEI
jgi:hypothetical protein